MANQRIHLIRSGESLDHFLYQKQQPCPKAIARSVCPREPQSEKKRHNIQTVQTGPVHNGVRNVDFSSYSTCMSYASFVNGLKGCSKAIAFQQAIGPKGGRPRKLQTTKLSTQKKKRLKKRHSPLEHEEESLISVIEGIAINDSDTAAAFVTAPSVAEALNVIEKRKKSIKAKMLLKKENLLTKEEEQDIHTRADIYAMTTLPDHDFYILPEDDPLPQPTLRLEDVHIVTSYPSTRKKRRRNYGTTNCYVNHHNDEDVFDNTKMLPLGTRLLKPPTKLVELVAHAIDGSPDGLLQVQQIYTFLQNKYPFYRYMEGIAINSWRSSIRHALYQKWFRKIRFDLPHINSKGCYWAINHKTSPKEWSLPENNTLPDEVQSDDASLEELVLDQELHSSVCSLLEEDEGFAPHDQSAVMAVAKELGISSDKPDDYSIVDVIDLEMNEDEPEHNVPQPVKEPDPILSTFGPGWSNEDMYMSSDDLGCCSLSSSTDSPLGSPTYLSSQEELRQQMFGNTLQSSDLKQQTTTIQPQPDDGLEQKQSDPQNQKRACPFSPLISWTPNWEEYGAYILSPHNSTSLKCLNSGLPEDAINGQTEADFALFTDLTVVQEFYNDMKIMHSDYCTSDSSDMEIIAEYPKPDFESEEEFIYG